MCFDCSAPWWTPRCHTRFLYSIYFRRNEESVLTNSLFSEGGPYFASHFSPNRSALQHMAKLCLCTILCLFTRVFLHIRSPWFEERGEKAHVGKKGHGKRARRRHMWEKKVTVRALEVWLVTRYVYGGNQNEANTTRAKL